MLKSHSRILLLILVSIALTSPAAIAAEADDAAIRKVHADFAAAWNRHDSVALAGSWSPDGDLINPEGRSAKGRAEIQTLFAEEQAGLFKGSTFTNTINGIRMLTPTVAIVDASYEISNVMPPGGQATTTLKGLYTSVMMKQGGKWWTVSARAMAPVPMAAAPAHH
jgi:uncharacterized protein (TIGR02246 family)